MRFLSETKLYKKIIKSPSYLNPVAGIFMIRQEKKHETTPLNKSIRVKGAEKQAVSLRNGLEKKAVSFCNGLDK